MARAVIFDFDGVVMDTEPLAAEAERLVLLEHGLQPFSEEEVRWSVGTANSFRKLMEKRGVASEVIDEMVLQRREKLKELARGIKPLLGVVELINGLKQRGFKLGLASSTRRELLLYFLEQARLDDVFDVVIAQEDVQRHKPNPEPYLSAAARLNVVPNDCAVIEDSANGIAAAKAAGCKVIALSHASTQGQDQSKADFIARSLREVSVDFLNKL